jgi:peptidoglycan/xylan/chitin deacetylase (PgdA/CDA1 family)
VKDRLRALKRATVPVISTVAATAAYYAGLYRMVGSVYGGVGVVFMLHRVAPSAQPIVYPGYTAPVDAVENLLATVTHLGWDLVSLDEAHRRLEQGGPCRRFVCFTFDDGYVDNLTLALPIFRKYRAPLTVNIATGLLDRSLFYWWGGLEELVLRSDVIDVPAAAGFPPMRLVTGMISEKRAAYERLSVLCHQFGEPFLAALRSLFERNAIDVGRLIDRDAMTIAQARELASDALVTIGAHGVTHRRISQMSDEEAWFEIDHGRRQLEVWLGVRVRHLAFPFGGPGACGPREFALAKKAGYQTAVTTRRGNLFAQHRDHLHCLPRRGMPLTRSARWNTLFGYETIQRGLPRFQTG